MSVLDLPAQFRGFCGEPMSELEIAYLLGVAQEHLPFPLAITAINDTFPDCEGVDPTSGRRITIELEVLSRNFQAHGHPPDGCDYIVCWEDNWRDAPVRVLSLKALFQGTPALTQRFVDRPRLGSLRDQLQELQTTQPTTYEVVTHFLDAALPALQQRVPAVMLDDRLARHFLVRYVAGKGLLGVYPSGKLVCAGEEDMVKTYGPGVAEPTRILRTVVGDTGTLRRNEQVPVVLDALEGLVHVIAQIERSRS